MNAPALAVAHMDSNQEKKIVRCGSNRGLSLALVREQKRHPVLLQLLPSLLHQYHPFRQFRCPPLNPLLGPRKKKPQHVHENHPTLIFVLLSITQAVCVIRGPANACFASQHYFVQVCSASWQQKNAAKTM